MALGSTMFVFTVRLADSDRNVYETLTLRVAQHPSETVEYLVTRVLAYCLEYGEGIEFSHGLSEPEEPTIAIRDLTGALQAWIDVGSPEPARLHKAGKTARRVAVYPHRDPASWHNRIAGERIHRSDFLEIYEIDRELLAAVVARVERRMDFDLTIAERTLYMTIAGDTITGAIQQRRVP